MSNFAVRALAPNERHIGWIVWNRQTLRPLGTVYETPGALMGAMRRGYNPLSSMWHKPMKDDEFFEQYGVAPVIVEVE